MKKGTGLVQFGLNVRWWSIGAGKMMGAMNNHFHPYIYCGDLQGPNSVRPEIFHMKCG